MYLQAVERELEQYAAAGERVHSIFFGGGTPSLMTAEQVERVLRAARRTFRVMPEAEITLECNPGDADLDKLSAFRALGANRLSFGIQSLDDTFLKLLGRRHSSAAARQAARWARQAGFNFNLDFMFGLPGQTLAHWQATLDEALLLSAGPPVVLPAHPRRARADGPRRRRRPPGAARGRRPGRDVLDHSPTPGAAGFEQYEISNWARPGQASRHNLTYWRDEAWIGVGAGAASSYAGRRWKDTPVLERYIESVERDGRAACVEDEQPDRLTQMLDYLTLGLRLREGVVLDAFAARFGVELLPMLGETGAWLLSMGLLECDGAAAAGRRRAPAHHQRDPGAAPGTAQRAQARRETSASQIAAR